MTADSYQWVYEHVGADLMLASITGGTDPGTAFIASNPTLPVYAGEMQCRGMGVATYAFNDDGKAVYDEVGELVCTQPIPSMPLYFWGDKDGKRYWESYFETWPGVWLHGDWLKMIPRKEMLTGVVFGRSDATINRYRPSTGHQRNIPGGRSISRSAGFADNHLEYLGRDSFMALFVVLRDDLHELSAELDKRIRDAIKTQVSARFVPDEIVVIPDVPRTISGKKLEVPIKKILLGQSVEKSFNRDSTGNPGSIDWFVEYAAKRNAKT